MNNSNNSNINEQWYLKNQIALRVAHWPFRGVRSQGIEHGEPWKGFDYRPTVFRLIMKPPKGKTQASRHRCFLPDRPRYTVQRMYRQELSVSDYKD
jgi:hypothetical protein